MPYAVSLHAINVRKKQRRFHAPTRKLTYTIKPTYSTRRWFAVCTDLRSRDDESNEGGVIGAGTFHALIQTFSKEFAAVLTVFRCSHTQYTILFACIQCFAVNYRNKIKLIYAWQTIKIKPTFVLQAVWVSGVKLSRKVPKICRTFVQRRFVKLVYCK